MTTLKFAKWPIYKLADLLVDFTKKNKNDEKIPVYSVTNEEGFTISTEYFSKEVFSKNLKTYKVVAKNEFAYNPSRVNVGSIDFFRHGGKGLISPLYVTFRTKEILNEKYLKYFLKSPIGNFYIRNNTSGSVRDTLSFRNLSKISIPLPPLEEQKRIVRLLDQADSLRQKRKKAISLLDDYLKAVFLEMFGDPVANPKDWGVTKIGKIIEDIRYGSSEKSADSQVGGAMPILRIPNILNGSVNYHDLKYQSLSEKEEGKLTLLEGDILFVRTNGNPDYIGRCAVFENNRKCVFASYLIRVRLKEDCKFNPFFIRYCLSMDSYRGKIRKESRTTAGNYNINTKGIKNFDLISPSKAKQDEFIGIMRKVEALKQSMFAQSEELDTNFNARMQEVFA